MKRKGLNVIFVIVGFLLCLSANAMADNLTDILEKKGVITPDEAAEAKQGDKGFEFPYLYDGDEQKTALAYGPVATPHCFVFEHFGRLGTLQIAFSDLKK